VEEERRWSVVTRDPKYLHDPDRQYYEHKHTYYPIPHNHATTLSGMQSVKNGADNRGFVSIQTEDSRYYLNIGNIIGHMFVRTLWSIIKRVQ
jgi:hypothetical protein